MRSNFFSVVALTVLVTACSSWASTARLLQQDGDTANEGARRDAGNDNSTAVVTDSDGFMEALLDSAVTTIYVDRSLVLNGTSIFQKLNESAEDYEVYNGAVSLTRSLLIVGRSSSGALNVLDFNLTAPFISIPPMFTLEFRSLRLRGIFYLLDQFPRFLTYDSGGNLRFTSVYLERPACRRLDELPSGTSGSSGSSGADIGTGGTGVTGGGASDRFLLAAGGYDPGSADSAASVGTDTSTAGNYGDMDDDVVGVENCTFAFSYGEALGPDCVEVAIPDRSGVIISSDGKFAGGGGTMGPAGGTGDFTGPSALVGASVNVSYSQTFLRCGLIVPRNCSQLTGLDLDACVQALLDARKNRPPSPAPPPTPPPTSPSAPLPPTPSPSPSLPSSPVPLPSSPSPLPSPVPNPGPSPGPTRVVGRERGGGSSATLLVAAVVPAVVGSLLLGAATAGGVVWWRRRKRRGDGDGGGGASSAAGRGDKRALQPLDSDQIPNVDTSNPGMAAPPPGKAGGGKGAATSPGGPFGAGGKAGRRRGPGETPVSVASGVATLSSPGLSSTLTGLMSSPGLSPNGSGNTDSTRSISLHYMLGAGSFGRVYYGTWQGQPVAVKIIPHSDAANAKVQQEVALCTRFNHPNVVRSLHYATFEAGPEHQASQLESLRTSSMATASAGPNLGMETWIVLEYCDGGSLASHLNVKATALSAAALQPGPSGGGGGALCGQESGVSGAGPGAGPGSSVLTSPEGSLLPPSQQQRDAALTKMSAVLSVARDIAAGMAYLHSLNVCHGDLKCENVLLCHRAAAAAAPAPGSQDDPSGRVRAAAAGSAGAGAGPNEAGSAACERSSRSAGAAGVRGSASIVDPAVPFVAKVADFGLSKAFSEASTHMSTATVGTVTHMCPVLLLTGQMRPSCDVFSFGVILWQLTTGGTPFAGMRYAEIVYKVAVAGLRPEFPPHTPRRLVAMAEACWAADPTTRPTFEQLVSELEGLLEAADELQAEQEGALQASREGGGGGVRPEDIAVAPVSPEDAAVASQWAAAAAAALLE